MAGRWVLAMCALAACDKLFLDPPGPTCEGEPCGPEMVCTEVLCIDSTEVTREQYARFVDTKGDDTSGQVAACADNASYVPQGNWPPSGRDLRPVVNVDWCDAAAFCAWTNKRLCGRIGGGAIPTSEIREAAKDQWYHACTGGVDGRVYPYGDIYMPGACSDGGDGDTSGPAEVIDHPDCVGGFPGIYDLSGNVWEWVDACNSDAPDAECVLRGGAYYEPATFVTCGTAVGAQKFRLNHEHFSGFRCCRDP